MTGILGASPEVVHLLISAVTLQPKFDVQTGSLPQLGNYSEVVRESSLNMTKGVDEDIVGGLRKF